MRHCDDKLRKIDYIDKRRLATGQNMFKLKYNSGSISSS